MKHFICYAAGFLPLLSSTPAGLVEKTVAYQDDGTTLEGFHVSDDARTGRRPAILVIHQWTGLSDYEKDRARQLAALGYNVFAADIYGQGIRPQPPEAGKEAGKYKGDRALYRSRLMAGLEVLANDPGTDPQRIGAIGYCFGGTGVLELARAAAPVKAVVSFHGGLDTPDPAQPGVARPAVLVLHGADDPYVPGAEVLAFTEEMRHSGTDWQMVSYGGAVHSFTQKMAGHDTSKGAAYNQKADARSWNAMRAFLEEHLGTPLK